MKISITLGWLESRRMRRTLRAMEGYWRGYEAALSDVGFGVQFESTVEMRRMLWTIRLHHNRAKEAMREEAGMKRKIITVRIIRREAVCA